MTVQLFQGDCLEVMPSIPDQSIDAIITDLPYGTTECKWDDIIPLDPMWKEVKRLLKPRGAFVTTSSQPFTSKLVMSNLAWFKYEWIWSKTMPTGFINSKNAPLKAHENILIFSPGTTANRSTNRMTYNMQMWEGKPYKKVRRMDCRTGVWGGGHRKPFEDGSTHESKGERFPISCIEFSNGNHNNNHPTQKPVALYEYLIKTYTNPGETVLDICFGSCTTGEACIKTGRNFIGIEKNPGYFGMGEARIQKVQMQPVMFSE
jgi:site-specific DNA-methyltransferase (adenine-specific)